MAIILCSCTKVVKEEKISSTPYASEKELNDILNLSDNYVDYRIVRKLVMLEMAELAEGHARAVTGTCKVQDAVAKKFLWIKWTDWKKTEYYYLWDNSHDYNNSTTTNSVDYSSYKNKVNDHFWEKDGTWFYLGTNTFKTKSE